jgi:FkbM family methyltransferase
MNSALWTLQCLASDSLHILKAPAGSKLALFAGLFSLGHKRAGFNIGHPDAGTAYQLFREIFARQCYHFPSRNDAPLVFDCGANVGVATMYFKWIYPHAHIHAFEADPSTFALLQRNIAGNRLTNITPHHCALWDKDGEIDFFFDADRPGELSMSTDGAYFPGQRIKVPACRLSEFINEPVDFLKMDIEGAEHRVLTDLVFSGKISLIRRMTIEYHHRIGSKKSDMGEFLKALEQAGFEYQIDASLFPSHRNEVFQAMFIVCYRPD